MHFPSTSKLLCYYFERPSPNKTLPQSSSKQGFGRRRRQLVQSAKICNNRRGSGLFPEALDSKSFPYCTQKPTWILSKFHTRLSLTTRFHSVYHRASSKLFADAEREEAVDLEGTPTRLTLLPKTAPKHTNWMGEESIEDAVLRILIDKYNQLHTRTAQTAEEKIRRTPSTVVVEPPAMPHTSETPTIPLSESLPSPSSSSYTEQTSRSCNR